MKQNTLHTSLFLTALVIIIFFQKDIYAQWVNDPAANTKLVIDPVDPVNITAYSDLEGGGYVFWEDKKGIHNKDIYYIRFDKQGQVRFRGDGKAISTKGGIKENPIAVVGPFGNALVLWSGNQKNNSELYIQKLSKNGLRLWKNEGIQLTESKSEKSGYSLCADKKGVIHVSYVTKTNTSPAKYTVKYQSLDVNGKFLSDSLKGNLYSSASRITDTKIIPDNKGGKYIFWLENKKNKMMLRAQYIDSTGSGKWGTTPLNISKENGSVINYTAGKLGNGIYTAYTYQGTNKIIYQNLISANGTLLWGNDGILLTYKTGSQSNPQFAFIDSTVVVSWTNEFEKSKDVFIQRFDLNGKRLWGNDGKRIIDIKGNQFGQRIVHNQKGSIILAWIDKKINSSATNLFIQKVNDEGELEWDSLGVTISSAKETEKSYLNLISDGEGGAIAVFKGTLNKKNEIYGQRIFSTGTYASQMLGFNAEVIEDSVKLCWYAANESNEVVYDIYRSNIEEADEDQWEVIASLKKINQSSNNYYEFYDTPDVSGTLYYRVVQKIDSTKPRYTNIENVNYFRNSETVILGQNSPNPFSDSTTINFYLPKSEEVTLEFFNSNIEMIKKVEDIECQVGKNGITFKAEDLPSGIYFYKLKAGRFIDVKKMIITD
ncbi:MAG: T9SS type A sorting domain-containing protein [Ignavibacteriaceae bacterium]|nr:T9SS type A sorting domain-containing protein [Ignavibacteriaceae bacterium]